jgi:hypothetical protein
MKFKFIKAIFVGTILSAICGVNVANAGLIINTTNDSFIDETTGLEWMDFGVNNKHTYNEVTGLLATTYSGWSLATETEVPTLYRNAFAGTATWIFESATGDIYARYSAKLIERKTQFDAIMTTMGYNGWTVNTSLSLGLFQDDEGGMSGVEVSNSSIKNDYVEIWGRGTDYLHYRERDSYFYSTMLVRPAMVTEPSILAIFVLGIIGLASLRFKKQS